jgi:hypothetical protein
VQQALPIVIVAVVAVAAVVAVVTAARGKGIYDDIRAGDLAPRPDPAHVREAEIAQMVAARQARRAARGLPPGEDDAGGPIVPVDPATPARSADDELRAEVQALVEARNARRAARGEPPLDVQSEVERRLRQLDG